MPQFVRAPVVLSGAKVATKSAKQPVMSVEVVISELLKETTSWLKRRELLSSLPDILTSQVLSPKLFPSLASAVAVQILDDRSALSRLGCEVVTKMHKLLRNPEMIVPVLACLVKQLANSAFVVSTAAAESLMEIMTATPAPCLFMRLASLYDASASVKIRAAVLRALVLPLKHVAVEVVETNATNAQCFFLDDSANLNQSFMSVTSTTSGLSWRAKVARTLHRVVAVDASAELRVLAKGALKYLGSSTRSPEISTSMLESQSPRTPLGHESDTQIAVILGGDVCQITESLRAKLKTNLTPLSDKTWAKVLTCALELRDVGIINMMNRREDGRRFLVGFKELIQHTFPDIVLSRGV